MQNLTYSQLSKRWHFLKFEDIGPTTDGQISDRLREIEAIELELKLRWVEDGCYETHGFVR